MIPVPNDAVKPFGTASSPSRSQTDKSYRREAQDRRAGIADHSLGRDSGHLCMIRVGIGLCGVRGKGIHVDGILGRFHPGFECNR